MHTHRLRLVVLLLTMSACDKAPAEKEPVAAIAVPPPNVAPSATSPVASSAPTESASPPSPSPSKAEACTPLAWDKNGLGAEPATFTGKIGSGSDPDANNKMEKFQTLRLDKPVCGPDKAPVVELQLYTTDPKIALAKLVGKKVTLDGEPVSAHTAHHHRPIVVEVKKLVAE